MGDYYNSNPKKRVYFVAVGENGQIIGGVGIAEFERIETLNELIITVTNIYPKDRSVSFHVTSFIQTKDDKIVVMDEYYADDGTAPQWRLDKHIGTSI